MGEVLVNKLNELKALPDDLHLFCPRTTSDPFGVYLDEDLLGQLDDETVAERHERHKQLEEAEFRKNLVLDCLPIFAFDGADAAGYQQWLKEKLSHAMGSCDACIRIYHRARNELRHKLEEDYDSDEVAAFMGVFDGMNLERITAGLDHATELLLSTPEESRGIRALDDQGMYALFESLSCEPLLKNEALLTKHFDEPFALVQTKKKLRLGQYSPAMTRFLFSYNKDRFVWALGSWSKFKRGITKPEFAAAVRDPLFDAMKRVQIACMDVEFLPTFWMGVRQIVEKLDKDLITHSLRAIEIDVCKLALEHLQFKFSGFNDLMATVQQLLEKSAVDFWDAMGPISPVTVIEQILGNQTLDSLLLNVEKGDGTLGEVFGWVEPFFHSIKPANQTPACRALVHQLLDRFQNDKYSRLSRAYSYQLGLHTLLQSLRKMTETDSRSNFVGYATVSDMLDFVKVHIEDILATIRVNRSLHQDQQIVKLGLQVVQDTLQLDCLSLEMDRETLLHGGHLHHDMKSGIAPVWDTVIKSIHPGDVDLATKVLMGGSLLVGMEMFVVKSSVQMSKSMVWWNSTFSKLSEAVTDVLGKLSDFAPGDLDKLFDSSDSAHAVIIHLFSSDETPRQAALNVVKTVSAETSRRDALAHITKAFYLNTLTPIVQTLRRVSKKQVFAPTENLLKICTDIVDILCNPQDGILRARSLTVKEAEVTELVWAKLWHELYTIFSKTEDWSNVGHGTQVMIQFCRDTMQFADALYDEYSHFANALSQAEGKNVQDGELSKSDIAKKLLNWPKTTMGGITGWLRLRDEYLINKSVALTSKLLVRLRDADIDIADDTRLFIEEALKGAIKTKLTPNQQAELERALEKHIGYSLRKEVKLPTKAKQGSISAWATSGTGKSSPLSSGTEESDGIKKLVTDITPGAAAFRERQKAVQQHAIQMRKAAVVPDRSDYLKKRELEKEEMKRKRQLEIQKAKKPLPFIGQTAEGGSGTRGIGVVGKDHTAKGEGVMVSSDESSDDDDDEIDEELFGPSAKEKKAPKARLPLIPQGPVKKKRVQRSFKDMRARLAPDLSNLHKSILSWDYFHEGDFPPNSRTDIYTKVPNKFNSPFDYKNTFQPLLTLEAWQGFVKAREEGTFRPFEVKVVTRSTVDQFIELSTNMSHADNKEIMISEGDICLLSKAPRPATTPDAPNCLARVYRITRKKAQLEILYRLSNDSRLGGSLAPHSVVYGAKIQSITPLEREYGALAGLQYYDLCDEICKAKPSPLLNYNDKQLQQYKETYSLNRAQAKAVRSAIDNDAFTLIQGPPGSGKTKTIVAIVGALLTDSLRNGGGTVITKPQPTGVNTAAARNNLPAPKKLLVCAPSNAAVDELVMRFKDGVKTTNGQHRKISVVRLGRSDAMNVNVKDVTLDVLVNARLNINPEKDGNNAYEQTGKIMKEHKSVSEKLNETREKLDSGELKGEALTAVKEEFDALRRHKFNLGNQIDKLKDAEVASSRTADLNRKRAQQAILDEAHVICATLSGSGHEMFQNLNIEFETVVVDEAAQCVEMSALIPLKYGCAKAILVGDPKQLPPTVFSKEAARFQYEQSLFVRMQTNHPNDVHLLDTQYRMHPEISYFPSQTFYDGRLLDGDGMAKLRVQPWHSSTLLAPYRFFDVQGQHQAAPKGHSLINIAEIDVAMALYNRLTTDFRDAADLRGKIGIITPYKSQLRELKDRFSRQYGESVFEYVEFNTTDAYQGRESEVIIFSCVRASPAGGIGFLQDIRRMNVGLTRAKSSLWVLGNSQSLVRGQFWKWLVEDAQKRGRYTQGNVMAMLKKHSKEFPAPNGAYDGPVTNGIQPIKREELPAPQIKQESGGRKGSSSASSEGSRSDVKTKEKSVVDDDWGEFFGDGAAAEQDGDEDVVMKEEPMPDTVSRSRPSSSRQSSEASAATADRPPSRASSAKGSGGSGGVPARPKMVPSKVAKRKADPFMPRQPPKKPRP
ncbi:trna-splicing endonuclease [Diplodia corticola]|uniref:Trna-splicing endonuclease n=1 Tax=Diplodia corticola TaxID=236234 RepID=A0A1J9S5T7_9PEZI|nr:trna-splicing endonuclease [Diplodia corticola]OJD35316.1 trna-splicing endonuclease [Diplodia corticola]